MPHPERLKSIRARMVSHVCIASAYAFCNDAAVDPPKGAVSSGLLLPRPLGLAGTCLLEQLVEINISPGGSRVMIVDLSINQRAVEQGPFGAQLEWVVECIDYLVQGVGIGSAAGFSKFMRGPRCVFFNIAESTVLKHEALNTFIEREPLDLSKFDKMRLSLGRLGLIGLNQCMDKFFTNIARISASERGADNLIAKPPSAKYHSRSTSTDLNRCHGNFGPYATCEMTGAIHGCGTKDANAFPIGLQ